MSERMGCALSRRAMASLVSASAIFGCCRWHRPLPVSGASWLPSLCGSPARRS